MTAQLPVPVDLPLPDVRPADLAALTSVLAGAAFHAGVLDAHLTGPAASAPGWLGADSTAAAEQVGRTAALTRQVSDALTTAWHRLDAHHELLVAAIGRIRALQAAQDDDSRQAHIRVAALLPDGRGIVGLPDSAAPIVDEFSAAERRRAQQHAEALQEVARDAAETALVLAGSCRAVGGTGSPGDGTRVFVHLAAELPGWGAGQLIALGARLADRIEGPTTRRMLDELARDALPYAAAPAFARALLTGLGQRGVAYLLTVLGAEVEPTPGPLAALLARALGAAWPSHAGLPPGADPLTDVYEGQYVDARSRDGAAETIVVGIGQVLLAGGSSIPPTTVATWGRQMLARERAQDLQGGVPMPPPGPDPVVLVLECLGQAGDGAAAAALLASRTSWEALLQRSWDDGGAALGAVVAAAATAPGAAGGAALTAGLAALGTGLSPGSTKGWMVNRDTVAQLAPGLGLALATHADVVTALLAAGLPFHDLDAMQDSALRGLGYLTIDERAARTIAAAITTWAMSSAGAPSPRDLDLPLGVAIGSFVAVRQYGQRLAYALHGAQEMHDALDRQFSWDMTVGLAVSVTPGVLGKIAQLLVGPAAQKVGADGTWQNGPDLGMVLTREDAAATAGAVAEVHGGFADPEVMDQARAGFDITTEVLGTPRPPGGPDHNALDELPSPPDPPEVDHEVPRFGRGGR